MQEGNATIGLLLGVGLVALAAIILLPNVLDSNTAQLNAEARLLSAQASLTMAHAQSAHIAASDARADVVTYSLLLKDNGTLFILGVVVGAAAILLLEFSAGQSLLEWVRNNARSKAHASTGQK